MNRMLSIILWFFILPGGAHGEFLNKTSQILEDITSTSLIIEITSEWQWENATIKAFYCNLPGGCEVTYALSTDSFTNGVPSIKRLTLFMRYNETYVDFHTRWVKTFGTRRFDSFKHSIPHRTAIFGPHLYIKDAGGWHIHEDENYIEWGGGSFPTDINCRITTTDLRISHGTLSIGKINGNKANTDLNINCNGPAYITLKTRNREIPLGGSKISSILSAYDTELVDGYKFSVNNNSTIVPITSKLKYGGSGAVAGVYEGSAVIEMTYF